jgi:hypothetical protein
VAVLKAVHAQPARIALKTADAHQVVVATLKNLVPHRVIQPLPAPVLVAAPHEVKASAPLVNAVPGPAAALD